MFDTTFQPGGGDSLWTLIEEKILTVNGTIQFVNFPSTFTDLFLITHTRSTRVSNFDVLRLQFNNDIGANYDFITPVFFGAAGYTTVQGIGVTSIEVSAITAANSVANDFAISHTLIPYYSLTGHNRDLITLGGARGDAAAGNIRLYNTEGHWRSTAVIAGITLFAEVATNLVAGSRARLFGIK